MNSFQKGMKKALAGLGAVLGGLAVGELIKDSIRAAMDVQGSMLQIRRTMGANATVFENWAQTQAKAYGMAREEAYKYGATYSNLISSFVQDTQETTRYTIELLQASSVVAEKTGRNVEDVMERIRSGLLGNTEAIEDLGIHVNIAMLESTEAFRLFARGRSWKQLTFQEQQQIRLLSILEQAYVKYGDTLAGTVHTKQLMFIATLKNIRLNLGQAFLPVYNTVLPVLTDLASKIEANKETLQRWGQSIAGVVRTVVKGFSLITDTIAEHWQTLKFVATTLITYTAITKGAAAATTAWRLATLALKGELMTKVPVLTTLSAAIGTYRLQMALAPAATNLFTAALLRLRVALYAVHTALGPIGWAVLAISAAASGGMAMWNKYNQSLQKTTYLGFGDFRKAQDGMAKSAGAAADASEDQADAIDKARKAAKRSLASFDEIHQLQKDMAGGDGSGEDILDDFDIGGGGIPGLDMGDMLSEIEQMKPTLKGFWEWIKQGAGNLWQGVKEKWNGFWDWVKSWGLWRWLADRWDGFKNWVGNLWEGVKDKWGGFKGWAGNLWDGIKEKWGGFTDWVGEKWSKFKDKSGQIWDGIKTNVQKSWESLKTNVPIVWEGIKTNIETSWNTLSTGAKKTWASIKDTIQSNWDILKKEAPAAWDNIKTAISTKANEARDALKRAWDEITKKTNETWTSIKTNSGTAWNNIKTFLSQTWSSIQSNAGNTLTNMRNTISKAWNNIRSTTQTVWNNIKNAIISPIESAKQTVLNIIDRIKSAFANMKITIPKPKLPHITVTTKTKKIGDISIPIPDFDINWYAQGGIFDTPSVIGVGEAGAEAVLPLERNTGWMDTLAAKIAAAIPGGPTGGDIYVYVGNEQVDAYVYRSQDRRNVKSNGR